MTIVLSLLALSSCGSDAQTGLRLTVRFDALLAVDQLRIGVEVRDLSDPRESQTAPDPAGEHLPSGWVVLGLVGPYRRVRQGKPPPSEAHNRRLEQDERCTECGGTDVDRY